MICQACNKFIHNSRKARAHLRHLKAHDYHNRDALNIYHCPHGNGFHVGHKKRRTNRKLRSK